MRGGAMLGFSLIALGACSTATPGAAPSDAPVEVSACEKMLEGPCTLPNGGRPFRRVAFPDIKDRSSLRITLERTMCDFDCPAYTVTVAGNGTVFWHGEHGVKTKGAAVAQIAPEKVRALFEAFRKAEFFWLFDKYSAIETAGPPWYITGIAFDGHTKTVYDYAGEDIGMPAVVRELGYAIDEAADTAQWIGPPDDPARKPPQ